MTSTSFLELKIGSQPRSLVRMMPSPDDRVYCSAGLERSLIKMSCCVSITSTMYRCCEGPIGITFQTCVPPDSPRTSEHGRPTRPQSALNSTAPRRHTPYLRLSTL